MLQDFTWTKKIWGCNVRWPSYEIEKNKIKYIIRTRKFELNLGWSYFFHQLSLILFLFCSYIFALSLDWATVFFLLSVVEITPYLLDKLFFDIYLLIAVHFYFPNLDKKFFILISALIVLILFLFSSRSHCSFKIVLIVIVLFVNFHQYLCVLFLFHSLTCIYKII